MSQTWTTADFGALGWHDCHVHGFRLADINDERGTAEVEFDIDYIPSVAREQRVDFAMSNSFGFGGTNAALVLARYKGD